MMKFIGITGGVGAGKSEILSFLEKRQGTRVMLADHIAHELMEPETDCYMKLKERFGDEEIYTKDGHFDRDRLAAVIFSDAEKREALNAIVHPAVRTYIQKEAEKERENGELEYLVLEAALLIEEHYDEICDELWYIKAEEEIRRKRLKAARGYSNEKTDRIMESQLSDEEYEKHCKVVIDNNGRLDETLAQIDKALRRKQMNNNVFGLDIGTRNVVGTVGYRTEDEEFVVVAQYVKQHETRAMLDGQIHDIGRVARTINAVKEELEKQTGEPLTEVCIAAAGRVLKTVTTHVEYEYAEDSLTTGEDIHTLNLLGIESAQKILQEKDETGYKFYCVGYSIMKYYLNDDPFISIEGHKARKIGEDIIVTFLPEDVVEGLYTAVGQAGLSVANMTLEPIAAINVAIPENYRMLNIALVDVGAGTSDISITKDGSIIAYGMIPYAGDELTELIVQHYLVDFKTAEDMKLASSEDRDVEYTDIMGIEHTVPAKEIWDLLDETVDKITAEVAAKIKELNGGNTVSACFVVGGGGKIHGYTEKLAERLELVQERVALRGEEVLQEAVFKQEDIKKDPLLVTPIGICLNYYEQKNNFIMVRFNGERLKLYDNNRLTIVDAALQAGFPNDQLFPKRGVPINFTVNGAARIARGEAGEAAIVTMNGEPASINTPLEPNCDITIQPSTAGDDAVYTVGQLEEYRSSTISFIINGQKVSCPKFVEVNGSLESETYHIKEGDVIETRNFYTVEQIAKFMDVEVLSDYQILVNNREADLNTLVYENFTIDWTADGYRVAHDEENRYNEVDEEAAAENLPQDNLETEPAEDTGFLDTDAAETEEEQESGSILGPETDSGVNDTETGLDEEPESGVFSAQTEFGESPAEPVPGFLPEEAEPELKPETGEIPVGTGLAEKAGEIPAVQEESVPGTAGTAVPEPASRAETRREVVRRAEQAIPEPEIQKPVSEPEIKPASPVCMITVNGEPVELTGKKEYIFVDIFDFISFDLTAGRGRGIITKVNGEDTGYSRKLSDGDKIEIYWEEN